MKKGRSTESAEPASNPEGLSRRGWILLVAVTAVVAIVAVVGVALAAGMPAGQARGGTSSTPQTQPPHALDTGPTPLRLPPRPTPTEVATVPSRPVDSLAAGDCLQTYPSPWADAYPVVDCAAPHIAQLLTRGDLPQADGTPFPGTKALEAQVTDLCGAPGLLNWDWVAVWNEDVQIGLRYPNTAAQWQAGSRSYYCFVYTYSRHELTGSAVLGH